MTKTEYPWHRLNKGESFFIPALDMRKVEFDGMKEAVKAQISRPRATRCLYCGLLGVMFTRVM